MNEPLEPHIMAELKQSYNAHQQRIADASDAEGKLTERGKVVAEIMTFWDSMVAKHPELRREYNIAMSWLTKTFTVEELNERSKP